MRSTVLALIRAGKHPQKTTSLLAIVLALLLSGCSSIKAPDALKNLSLPNIPSLTTVKSKMKLPENDPSFKPRMYAGGSIGRSTLSPDTSGTVFSVAEKQSRASQFRLGIDLHNRLSLELNTSILGEAKIAEGNDTDVSFTGASINALFYGLGLSNTTSRSMKTGFSGYGRLGYGIMKHGSIVDPLDFSRNSFLLGLGAEYGFLNGFSARAEITRFESEAMVISIGGVYRFGTAPTRIGQVFLGAAKPALGAARSRTEVRNGKVVTINEGYGPDSDYAKYQSPQQMLRSAAGVGWPKPESKLDVDGDGIADGVDQCTSSPANTTVSSSGCGMFDVVLSDVTFKSSSDWLTPKARGQLDSLIVNLLAFPEARVLVRAHTDNQGPADINLGLSARRAESVVEYLTEKGVGELQLETEGMGESQPIDNNDTAEGRKANRRVDLKTLANISPENFLSNGPHLGAANPIGPHAYCDSNSSCSAAGNCLPLNIRQ